MSIHYGFFNSLNGDRKYFAEDFGKMFDGVIVDGVFQNVGNHFAVSANGGLNVAVATGRAWLDHTWIYTDSVEVLPHEINNTLLDRIDAVVIEVNHTDRRNYIKVVKGPTTATTRPTLTFTETIKQYPLAYVTVGKSNASTITQGNIVNMVGTSSTPFVTAPLEKIDADSLYAQWAAQFSEFLTASSGTFDGSMTNWSTEFTTWFEALQPLFEEEDYQQILLMVQSVTNVKTVTFTANGWTEVSSALGVRYTQTVSNSSIMATHNPVLVSYIDPTETNADIQKYLNNFGILSRGYGSTADGSVTWMCFGEKPDADITVALRGE